MNVNDIVRCGKILIFGKWYGFICAPVVFKLGFNLVGIRGHEFTSNIDIENIMEIRMNSKI